jgi:hypothetical protein
MPVCGLSLKGFVRDINRRPENSAASGASIPGGGIAWHYGAFALVIIFFALVRMRLRAMPLERDEGEYAYMGQLMLRGIAPFKLAANMKLPGTHAAYAVLMAIFGQTTAGIHIGMLVVNAVTSILVLLLGRRLYGPLAGTVAGSTYAFLSCRPAVLGIDGHATHFVALGAVAGILVLLSAIESGRVGLFFLSGIFFGLAFLMKQPGILFAVFAAVYWLGREWKEPRFWHNLAFQGAAFAAGVGLPFGLMCLILWRAGVFPAFWFWTWTYAREYGAILSLADGWRLLGLSFRWAVRPFVIWEIALVGLAAPAWSLHAREHGLFTTEFFLFSCAAVCPGLYFRPHYFILLLPAVALCTGLAVALATRSLRLRQSGELLAALPAVCFAVVFFVAVRGQYITFFRLDPVSLSRKIHVEQPYLEAVEAAGYISCHSSAGDQIGIIGSEPEICFYTRLQCATRYLYMFPLLEKQRYAPQMQRDVMREIESSRPKFLVYVDDEASWGWSGNLDANRTFFENSWAYANRQYEPVDAISIAGNPVHLWGERASLYVFRRKE